MSIAENNSGSTPYLSIVIPVYNEQDNIAPLFSEIKSSVEQFGMNYEVIFVDDGSTDGTFDVLEKLFHQDEHVVVIRHRGNFGQTPALSSGISQARGQVIVTMDGDMQNDPRDIAKLIEPLNSGYQVVSGWRKERHDPFFKKQLPSRMSNWLARRLLSMNLHDFGCTFKAYKAEAIRKLRVYGEGHRYIPALLLGMGYRIAEVPVSHRERHAGRTKYGITRLGKGFLDLLYLSFWAKYARRPLHYFGGIGLGIFALGVLIGVGKLIQLIAFGIPLDVGPLLLFSVLAILAGIQLVLFGFLAEIQVRTYFEVEDKANDMLLCVLRR